MRAAAFFGHHEALQWLALENARLADRSCDQKCFYEIASGF